MAAVIRRYGKVLIVLVFLLGLGVLVGFLIRRSPAQVRESSEAEPVASDPNTWVEELVWSGRDPNASELSGDFPIGDFLAGRQEIIFRNLMAEKAGTDEALRAQSRLVNVLTELGRSVDAQAELEAMLTTYAGRERLPHTLSDMVRDAQRQGTSNELGSALTGVLDQFPSGTGAMWLKMAVALNHVYTGEDEQVGPAVARLVRDHAADPGCAEAVVQVAWRYRLVKKPALAKVYYETALRNWPDNPRAIYHQRGLVYALLAGGDEDGAWAAANDLLTKFAQHEKASEMIVHMARQYRGRQHGDEAQTLFEYVVQNYPADPQALTAQHELVLLHLSNGNDIALEQGIADLLNHYSEHDSYARDVCRVARHLELAGKPAQDIYETVLSQCAQKTDSLSTQLHVAIAQAALGDAAACAATRTLMLSNFGSDPKLPEALSTLGESLYFHGQLAQKAGDDTMAQQRFVSAAAEWEDLIERFPEDKEVARAHLCLAGAYEKYLGDVRQALAHYEAIAWNWPDSPHAWNAQFMIGHLYEQLELRGLEPRQAAAVKIRTAYQAVVQAYPDSPVAQAAARGLARWKNL